MSNSKSGLPVYADTAALSRLARNLRRASPQAWKAYKAAVHVAAEALLREMQANASFSSRIPQSGRIRVTAGGNVVIEFTAPDAAAIENKGKGFVRHPVYGNREVWTEKNSHAAFAAPALEAGAPAVVAAIEEALAEAIASALSEGL